jgi:DNA-binding transcriptional ArsR family regulator
MNARQDADAAIAKVASVIGERARARILLSLMDGHARTSTELAVVAAVSASTASVHLNRLKAANLVKMQRRGKHRFYSLAGPELAAALEGLSVLGGAALGFRPDAPTRLRVARSCYDHLAGVVGVALHDRFKAMGWIAGGGAGEGAASVAGAAGKKNAAYELSASGAKGFEALGIDVAATRMLRRKFASACLDWSERRPHVGGALGAAILDVALKRRWVVRDLDSRALSVTSVGKREMGKRFGVEI